MRVFFLLGIALFAALAAGCQPRQAFPDRCAGVWSGTMQIFRQGVVVDSVPLLLTIAPEKPGVWLWKTAYLSEKQPLVKDYRLLEQDAEKGGYLTDEGDGLLLHDYVCGNKMYSLFETGGLMLTATYELLGEALIFEVTAGKKVAAAAAEVGNFQLLSVQRAVLRRR
jgi:hypothetical protein